MQIFGPLIGEIISIIWISVPLAGLYFGAIKAFETGKPYFVESEPNEWMIVVRDGKPILTGVGIYTLKMPGDQIAKFPTRLRTTDFSAEQVT
jgi:hypothetical protein